MIPKNKDLEYRNVNYEVEILLLLLQRATVDEVCIINGVQVEL